MTTRMSYLHVTFRTLYFKWKEDKWNISDKMKEWKYLIRSFTLSFLMLVKIDIFSQIIRINLVDRFGRLNFFI